MCTHTAVVIAGQQQMHAMPKTCPPFGKCLGTVVKPRNSSQPSPPFPPSTPASQGKTPKPLKPINLNKDPNPLHPKSSS